MQAASHRRRVRAAEQPGAGLVVGEVLEVQGTGDVSADDAEGLRERAHLDLHALVVQVEVGDDAASALAQHALAVGVVHVEHGPVLLGQLRYLVQRRHVPVHGEHAVGDDEDAAIGRSLPLRLLELQGQVVHVAVLVDGPFGGGQAHAVDYAAMVQLVGDYEVALAHQLRYQSGVGGEAGLVHQGSRPVS